jgi:hypothetical protein
LDHGRVGGEIVQARRKFCYQNLANHLWTHLILERSRFESGQEYSLKCVNLPPIYDYVVHPASGLTQAGLPAALVVVARRVATDLYFLAISIF